MIPSPLAQPATWYRQMQEERPVYFDPDFSFYFGARGGWQVFRYKDAQRVLGDYEVFSNEYMPKMEGNLLGSNLNQTDPPRHRQLRALISKAFAPSVMAHLDTWIYRQCESLLAPWLDAGEMDFVQALSIPLPGNVTAQLLGVPNQDHAQVNAWISAIASDPAVIGMDAYFNAQQEMGRLFMELLEARRQQPQPDLITHLLQAEIDGEKLSQEDTLAFCVALLIAGNETTNGFLANAMYTFARLTDVQEHLAGHPQHIPSALGEVLRFQPPVQTMVRIARQDTMLGGQQVRKGDLLNVWIAAANRDPEIFPDPDRFDMHRDSARALSFGHGVHYCIGAMLAKMEARIAFEVIFSRMRNIRIKPGEAITPSPSTIISGFPYLPVVFEKC